MQKSKFRTKTEEELVSFYLQEGDSAAFAEIYERLVDDVYRFVYSRCGNKETTEDIVSDTFMTLMDVLDAFNHKSKLKTFVIGIALNKIRQSWDKVKKNSVSFDEEILDDMYDRYVDDFDPEQNSEKSKETLKSLKNVLENLKPNYRQVLEERFLEGKSIRECAEVMGKSETNITTLQNRALKKASEIANKLLSTENVKAG